MTLDTEVQVVFPGWRTVKYCCWEKLALPTIPLGEDKQGLHSEFFWTLSVTSLPLADFNLIPLTGVNHSHEQAAGNSASPSNEFLNMKVVLGTPELAISVMSNIILGP